MPPGLFRRGATAPRAASPAAAAAAGPGQREAIGPQRTTSRSSATAPPPRRPPTHIGCRAHVPRVPLAPPPVRQVPAGGGAYRAPGGGERGRERGAELGPGPGPPPQRGAGSARGGGARQRKQSDLPGAARGFGKGRCAPAAGPAALWIGAWRRTCLLWPAELLEKQKREWFPMPGSQARVEVGARQPWARRLQATLPAAEALLG